MKINPPRTRPTSLPCCCGNGSRPGKAPPLLALDPSCHPRHSRSIRLWLMTKSEDRSQRWFMNGGTCYRAANWIVAGSTTGRGKNDQTHRPNRTIKDVLVLPLTRQFREPAQRVTRGTAHPSPDLSIEELEELLDAAAGMPLAEEGR